MGMERDRDGRYKWGEIWGDSPGEGEKKEKTHRVTYEYNATR